MYEGGTGTDIFERGKPIPQLQMFWNNVASGVKYWQLLDVQYLFNLEILMVDCLIIILM